MRIVTRIQNDTYIHIYSPVTCHLSLSPVHLSPTPTARATNPPPAKSPTMNSRLVQQDRTPIHTKMSTHKKIIETFPKKGLLVLQF